MTGLPQIRRDELWQLIERGDPIVLIDALAPMSYAHSHLPGAINLIPERVDDEASRRIPDLEADVIVYCANESCESSVEVAERLVELGYRRVRHYPGGKSDWTEAGLPVEGRARSVR
jgi:rhodanese-related sulfurtransferase